MQNVILEIVENTKVSLDVYLMRLKGDLSSIKNSGEFVEIKLDGYYLRRPISVCEFSENELTILYKVLGHGTLDMTNYEVGKKLDVLVGLMIYWFYNTKKVSGILNILYMVWILFATYLTIGIYVLN
jgi:dihydroorotate dehydrogenase electron transfer subunit